MEESKNNTTESGINYLDYVIVILKHKEFIVKATLAAMFVALVVSLLIPPLYMAEAKILPPQTSSSSMATYFSQMGGMGMSALGVKTPNDLYINLLRSRPVVDYVISASKLTSGSELPRESLRNVLRGNLSVRDDKKSGIVTVGYTHRSPKAAADTANLFVEGLRNLNNELAVTEASQRRLFFEKQLARVRETLVQSEEELKRFQQRTGTLKIDEQAKAAIEETSLLRAKISAKEVQMRAMQSYVTPQNPEYQNLKDEVSALKEELDRLGYKGGDDESVLSARKISIYGTEYLRKMREFKYNESLYEILMKQYGAAKLDESKDASIVQIIESAIPPEQRLSPQRRKIITKTGLLAFFASILFVFLRIYYKTLVSSPEGSSKVERIRELLDFSQLSRELKLDALQNAVKSRFAKK